MQFDITGVTVLGFESQSGLAFYYNAISENHYRVIIFSALGNALPEYITFTFSGSIENLCIKNIILADSQGNSIEINDNCD